LAEEDGPHEELSLPTQTHPTPAPVSPAVTERIYVASEGQELRQGEIITNLIQLVIDLDSIKSGELIVMPKIHPFAMVVSQDCDLTQDYKVRREGRLDSDKILPNILLCEVITAAELRGNPGEGFNKDQWKRIKQNKDERYQFLEKVPADCDALGVGLPELGIDFKRYFSMPTDEIYFRVETEARRRYHFISPYLEHLSTRFSYFQYRIALPTDHRSE
jgi:hypothetical protein